MGYQDRDYIKDSLEPPNYVKIPQLNPIYWLIIACGLLSIIEADDKLKILTDISFTSIFQNGHIWAILLAPFSPEFFLTALFHCLVLYFIGRRILQSDGMKEFIFLYFGSALVGMMFFWSILWISPNFEIFRTFNFDAATWSLCGIGMVYAVRYPNEKVLLYFILPIQTKLLMTIIVLLVLLSMASNHRHFAEYVSLLASLGFGFLIAFYQIRLTNLMPRLKRFFGKVSLPITGGSTNLNTMSEDEIKREIDRLLDKITANGPASLSAKERDFLMKSSKRNK